jgi:glycerol-3-phosphate acyltransferase PlsX
MMQTLRKAGVNAEQLEASLKHLDYSEHGGAPLLGVNGVSIISHGKSSPRAIKNAIKVGVQAVETRMNEHIGRRLQEAAVPKGALA